jgi:hypothetical protein|tara:strand:- start:46 stop:156 length:111 start_codon:yes stop_codon:yes gene_type:complete
MRLMPNRFGMKNAATSEIAILTGISKKKGDTDQLKT